MIPGYLQARNIEFGDFPGACLNGEGCGLARLQKQPKVILRMAPQNDFCTFCFRCCHQLDELRWLRHGQGEQGLVSSKHHEVLVFKYEDIIPNSEIPLRGRVAVT